MQPNRYSQTWFDLFLRPVPSEQTEREVEFVARQLPRPAYRTVLDLCCGPGRHAWHLMRRNYRVTGADWNEVAIAEARRWSGREIEYVVLDMRRLDEWPVRFDAVVNLWQSFGYFDEATNLDVLRQIRRKLNLRGRLILDLYHRGFFEEHEGTRTLQIGGRVVTENRFMEGHRLRVSLDYGPDRTPDLFEWQLYTPEELIVLSETVGLKPLLACADFDAGTPPTRDRPRMQLVFEA